MSRATNPLTMLIPAQLLGLAMLTMLVGGGLAMILGARRTGQALVLTAIALPFVRVLVQALTNSLSDAMPEWLVTPAAMLFMLVSCLMVGWALIKLVFGHKAVEEAKGHLLADALKGLLRMMFTRAGLVATGGAFVLLYINVRQ